MPIVQNCWISELSLADKIKINNKNTAIKSKKKEYKKDVVKSKKLQEILAQTNYNVEEAFVEELTQNLHYKLKNRKEKKLKYS